MPHDEFFAIDSAALPWDERYNPKLGRAIFRKDLYTDPETGAEIRLVRYPAGLVNPTTHPCGHGLYVLEGDLVTHKGTFGPGTFVWFPEGEVMEHGAGHDADVTVLFVTNKRFRIDYVEWGPAHTRVPAYKPHRSLTNIKSTKMASMSDLHCPSTTSRRDFLAKGAVATGAFGLGQCGPDAAEAGEVSRFPLIGFSKPFQKLDPEQTAELVATVGWDGIECPVRAKGQIEPERARRNCRSSPRPCAAGA